ncbi:MAG: hypothetical protein J5742_03855 [Alphaproteobacteria bacterium]|nr:hypothetical protein [Alphaproteobacteria bacterium]
MSKLKKFLIVFLSFFPLSVGAAMPWLLIGGIATVAGFSVYRSVAPVNFHDALQFFSSCWTCQMFSSIMATMSNILPTIYAGIGKVVIPFAAVLTAIYFAWSIASGFMNSKIEVGWSMASKFGTHLVKFAFVCALLVIPLPRLLSSSVITPIFNIGLSVNHIVGDPEKFTECMVATTIMDGNNDRISIASGGQPTGAFPTKLRSGLACEVANIHQLTGLGMTIGWTMMNMAFNYEYMHKILWAIPIFPNIPIFFAGLLVLVLFFVTLLPVLTYFLEIFITLSLDLVMLPLMLLSWLFSGWTDIFPKGGKTIQGMINDVISGTVGIAMTAVFITFGIMFLDAIFGDVGGVSRIMQVMSQNDSKELSNFLIDGLLLRNDSLITMILMGAFFAMFMTSIPSLVKTLFNFSISDKFYKTAKNDFDTLRKVAGKWWEKIKK